ncbi:MAG TPA: 3-carboxy-cis,cis-muconate cycloisomerase, partial [Ktedonobacterales bacterium]|nr:3-carboxy-cis,cis-muconate cycloisomerase [Ktedonobacterales bacterium]
PEQAATAIGECCRAENFDVEVLAREAALAGNLAIPLVRALTALVAQSDPDAAQYVHWGATSQDVIDTGAVLQMRDALDLVEADLGRLSEAYGRLAREHKATVMAGRTWMQQGAPITFGLKVAGWLSAIHRHQERLRETRSRVLVVQFGGAVGTLAALGSQGVAVAEALAEVLQISVPDIPWHSERDRVVEVATTLGLITGTLSKIARDLALLSQTEVGEVAEPAAPGRGGSSSMPQKHNPVGSAVALVAAQRVPGLVATMLAAMPQEHERGLGGWQAEWETLPEICLLTAGALRHMALVAEGLEIDVERMRVNLDLTNGLIFAENVSMALAPHIGKQRAYTLLHDACARAVSQRRHLRDVLTEDNTVTTYLNDEDLTHLFDPQQATGLSEQLVERVVHEES